MAQATPLKLPSRAQLIKLIKQTNRVSVDITGLTSFKDCNKVSLTLYKNTKSRKGFK